MQIISMFKLHVIGIDVSPSFTEHPTRISQEDDEMDESSTAVTTAQCDRREAITATDMAL